MRRLPPIRISPFALIKLIYDNHIAKKAQTTAAAAATAAVTAAAAVATTAATGPTPGAAIGTTPAAGTSAAAVVVSIAAPGVSSPAAAQLVVDLVGAGDYSTLTAKQVNAVIGQTVTYQGVTGPLLLKVILGKQYLVVPASGTNFVTVGATAPINKTLVL